MLIQWLLERRSTGRDCVIKAADFSGSPVFAGEMIYLPGEDGDVFVVRAGKEYDQVAINSIGERLMSTPAIANDTLFVKGERHLIALRNAQ